MHLDSSRAAGSRLEGQADNGSCSLDSRRGKSIIEDLVHLQNIKETTSGMPPKNTCKNIEQMNEEP